MRQKHTEKHEQWLQGLSGGLIEKHQKKKKLPKTKEEKLIAARKWFWLGLLFLLALVPRLWFIFKVSNPDNPGAGWFGDAYHHWQIAYLTREIGLGQGFLRLWDLKGLEFFWGLSHPLMTMLAFLLSGGVTIASERVMTAVFGSFSVVLIYLLVKKYWSQKTALAASLLAALNPVGVFNDGSGMVEPVGIPFLLLAILNWPKRPVWTGILLVVALMARAEYWVFALGLLVAMMALTPKVKTEKKVELGLGFAVPFLAYMKYLLDWTGNPIYPFYYNYVTNIIGTWQLKTEFTQADLLAKSVFLWIFVICVQAVALVVWKKPKGALVYLLGLGNWMFLGASFGIGAYIGSYASYVWFVRFMILPYIFIGILVSLLLFEWVPKAKALRWLDKLKLNWLILLAVLVLTQPTWSLIMKKYNTTHVNWQGAIKTAGQIADQYHGGGLVFVEGNPELTYALVKVYGLEGKNMVSQMFDPYFYFDTQDPYADWDQYRDQVIDWLREWQIKTIVSYSQYERYAKLAEYEPELVSKGLSIKNTNLVVYQVDQDELYRE